MPARIVTGSFMQKFDSARWLADHPDIHNVRAVTFDINGVMRGKRLPIGQLKKAVNGVSAESVGKGRQLLGEEEVRNLENLVGMSLTKFGYLKNE